MNQAQHRATFFRQSGWLMVANVAGGVFMWAVHFLSKAIGPSEYGVFGVLLAVVMLVPNMPLQMVLVPVIVELTEAMTPVSTLKVDGAPIMVSAPELSE